MCVRWHTTADRVVPCCLIPFLVEPMKLVMSHARRLAPPRIRACPRHRLCAACATSCSAPPWLQSAISTLLPSTLARALGLPTCSAKPCTAITVPTRRRSPSQGSAACAPLGPSRAGPTAFRHDRNMAAATISSRATMASHRTVAPTSLTSLLLCRYTATRAAASVADVRHARCSIEIAMGVPAIAAARAVALACCSATATCYCHSTPWPRLLFSLFLSAAAVDSPTPRLTRAGYQGPAPVSPWLARGHAGPYVAH